MTQTMPKEVGWTGLYNLAHWNTCDSCRSMWTSLMPLATGCSCIEWWYHPKQCTVHQKWLTLCPLVVHIYVLLTSIHDMYINMPDSPGWPGLHKDVRQKGMIMPPTMVIDWPRMVTHYHGWQCVAHAISTPWQTSKQLNDHHIINPNTPAFSL